MKRAGSIRSVGPKQYTGPVQILKRKEATRPHGNKADGDIIRFRAIPSRLNQKAGQLSAGYRWVAHHKKHQIANKKATTI